MSELFGKKFNKKDLLKRVGNISQIMGAEKYICNDGQGKGTEVIQVRNGKGLNITIVPDRALDIVYASYKEVPLAWVSRNKISSNAHYDDKGLGWLRNFGGGLLTTCGLINAGGPSNDQGMDFGLHGRISNIAAENVSINEYWKDDEYYITVSGRIREAATFFENIALYREITVSSKDNKIEINDKVVNEGYKKEPWMMIYHINFGYPLVSKESDLVIDLEKSVVRGEDQSELNNWKDLTDPVPGIEEVVYFHSVKADSKNKCKYQLLNKKLGIGVETTWDKSVLDTLIEWKMMGESEYVLGLEPSNCHAIGRGPVRESGNLKFIDSFEEKNINVVIEVLDI